MSQQVHRFPISPTEDFKVFAASESNTVRISVVKSVDNTIDEVVWNRELPVSKIIDIGKALQDAAAFALRHKGGR
jgi:hypothetical protein